MPYESGHNEKTETGQFVHKITFNFVIPMTLLPHDPAINEQHQYLPPSIKAGDSITDRAGRTYMQPLINYVIHAVVNFGGLVRGDFVKVQNTREIMLIPFTEIAPPLSTEDFPGEYTSISTQSLTKIPFGGLFGELSISMDEPSALRFSDSFPNASTLGYLTLALRLVDTVANNIRPKRLTCTIRSGVLVKEAFSTMPLRGMPSYFMLNTEKCLRARSCYIALQTRKIDLHSWESKSHPRPGRNEESQDSTWVTSLILPICCSRRLLPTFCSALAALRYVLRVHLNIKDMYHSPLTLEVPLQVVYCRRVENAGADSIVNDDHDQPNIHDFPGTLQVSYSDSMAVCLILLMHHSFLDWTHFHLIMVMVKKGSSRAY